VSAVPHRWRVVPTAGLLVLSFVSSLIAQEAPPAGTPAEAGPPVEAGPSADAGAGDGVSVAAARAAAEVEAALDAETSVEADRPYWRTNLFKRFFSDQKYMFTTWWPSEMRRYQFTGPLLAGMALAAAHGDSRDEAPDAEIQDYVQVEADEHGSGLPRAFSFIGNMAPASLLLGVGYLVGRWGHHDRMAEASSLSAEALLTTGLYVTFLKRVTARTRPAGGVGTFFTYHTGPGQSNDSFPSGHAAGAFTVATVFAETYKDHPWVGWVSYGAAGMVGWARVAQGRHFVGDVLVGGLLGHSIGRMVATRNREESPRRFEVQPIIDPAGDGVGAMVDVVW
jgi:PAP2 superfamily protein